MLAYISIGAVLMVLTIVIAVVLLILILNSVEIIKKEENCFPLEQIDKLKNCQINDNPQAKD